MASDKMEPLNLDEPAPPTTGRSANAERMLDAARKVMAMPDPWAKHRLDEVIFSARSLSFARRRNPPERGALAQLPEEKVVLHAYVDGAWTTREKTRVRCPIPASQK